MGQDLRKLLKEDQIDLNVKMRKGHESRFMQKLEDEMPEVKRGSLPLYLKIAAAIIFMLAAGYSIFKYSNQRTQVPIESTIKLTETNNDKNENQITLGSISPSLKKVEDFYVTNINLELSEIDVTDENRQLLDGYMKRLTDLNDEYTRLNTELNEGGLNESVINALINNLQIRLQLLYDLKEKLNELKENQNETIESKKA